MNRLLHKSWVKEIYLKVEKLTHFIPDRTYLKIIYRIRTGQKLNLDNPQTFNEKMQWLKLYDRNPAYTIMVDKYEVKKYVAEIIGERHIIPTLGVWSHFDEIDFETLPNQFVLKCTHDSGGMVIVRDKNKFDKEAARKKIEKSLKRNFYWKGREWPYKNVKPRIIAEKYMEDGNSSLIRDYKFFVFNREILFMYVSEGLENHETASISFFSLDGKQLPFKRLDFEPFEGDLNLPDGYQNMLQIAEKLAKRINDTFVRIDLYCINGETYFSEITLSPCGGMIPFEPVEWDEKLGKLIKLPNTSGKFRNDTW